MSKYLATSRIAFTGAICALLYGCGGGGNGGPNIGATKFAETNLVADVTGKANKTDANLVNSWGIASSPSGPFWVADNGTGVATVYNTAGSSQGLVVTIPAAGGGSNGPVSGQVYNGTSDFPVPGSGPATFIFVSEDGIISAWNSGGAASLVADRSGSGTVYKGLALGVDNGSNFVYATNFNGNAVDMFDKNFAFVKSFTDANIPAGYAPFGIANIGGSLYVSFALQNAAKHDDVRGSGHGYVDVFSTDGTLLRRLISGGPLNSPWAIVQAPAGLGSLGGALLVGNFGDGHINAFNASTGAFLGPLRDGQGQTLVIDGLWGLIFGNGGQGGNANTLYFTAGPNGESHGLFGALTPAP